MRTKEEIEERLKARQEVEEVRIKLRLKPNLVIEAFTIALEWVLQDSV